MPLTVEQKYQLRNGLFFLYIATELLNNVKSAGVTEKCIIFAKEQIKRTKMDDGM